MVSGAAEQPQVARGSATAAAEQRGGAAAAIADATEQDGVANDAIPDPTDERENPLDVEEAKSDTDEPPTEDDVNVVATADLSDCESDADDEDVMADNVVAPDGVDDEEDVERNEDDLDTGMFDLTDGDLRIIAESGWVAYDEDKSGNLQVDAATDYYD
ncbi:uncharacterized protein IUM83_16761 [Phytophthora cinnamomi]|uniref:uncharacterized protein n=1 Tax=Phytophthora cinnamomi TaxID=4785 RepID=UPI00355A279D|nr:hypothetical protein IUM83_16761 [Phytophthora cinnamomi]